MADYIELIAKMMILVSCICILAILLGYPAAHWIGWKIGEYLSCLPTETFSKAPPALGIPATMAIRGNMAGAVEAYEALLLDHPKEKEIYFRLVEIALGPMASQPYADNVMYRASVNLTPCENAALVSLSDAMRAGSFTTYRHLGSPHRAV